MKPLRWIPILASLSLLLFGCDGESGSNQEASTETPAETESVVVADADAGPCPIEEIPDVRRVMKVKLQVSGPNTFKAVCANTGASAKDLVLPRGYWLYLTNELGEGVTLKFKNQGSTDANALFGRNGQVEVGKDETIQLRILDNADQATNEYSILGSWAYGDPGPTIRVP